MDVGKCKQKALSESRKVKHIALFHLHHGLARWDELSKYTLYCITEQFDFMIMWAGNFVLEQHLM